MLRMAKSWDGLVGEGKRPAIEAVFKTSSEKNIRNGISIFDCPLYREGTICFMGAVKLFFTRSDACHRHFHIHVSK